MSISSFNDKAEKYLHRLPSNVWLPWYQANRKPGTESASSRLIWDNR
jgi:hypothetical protein